MVQMKIKISSLLMEAGVSYNKQRLHKAGYFRELLATNPDIDEGLRALVFQRAACQVSPLSRLGARAQAPDAPVD